MEKDLTELRKELKKDLAKGIKKIKKGKKSKESKVDKFLKKKLPSKRVFKKSQTTLSIQEKEVPSILGDPNRFFKDNLDEDERLLFFK